MFITKYFQVFNLTVPSSWIALLLSFAMAYVIVRVKFGKASAHFLGDAIFYFVIVWKLSVVLTDFKTILQSPLSILYFNGGVVGVYLGVLAVGIHLFIASKNNGLSHSHTFSMLVASIATLSMYQLWMALFNTGPFLIRFVTVVVFFVFILILVVFMDQFKDMLKEFILLTIGLHLFISVLQPAGIFQTSTIITIIVGGVSLLSMMRKRKSYRGAEW